VAEKQSNRANGRPRRRWSSSGYAPRRKVCSFCVARAKTIDYKNFSKLQQYITDRGKITPRRKTGVCARHQRALAKAIKRARHLALLPYVPSHQFYQMTGKA
jgi:small subunit ribosomal protein S18